MTTIAPPASTQTPRWLAPVLFVAILASVAVSTVIAARLSVPAPAASSPSGAERAYLRIMATSDASVLPLGRTACKTMNSGQATHAEYRMAEGQLMAYQHVSPAYAEAVVHAAMVSGLCTEQGGQVWSR